MGHPVQGPGQPIQGPIQGRFVSSLFRQVYYICKSNFFHDMRTECQRIKTSYSYLTVLPIYHTFPAIYQSLAPQSLKN